MCKMEKILHILMWMLRVLAKQFIIQYQYYVNLKILHQNNIYTDTHIILKILYIDKSLFKFIIEGDALSLS